MDEREFSNYLRALEFDARKHPTWYRFRVACLIVFAYLFIFLVIASALAMLAGLCWLIWMMLTNARASFGMLRLLVFLVPVLLGLVAFIFSIFAALNVHLPDPEGVIVEKGRAIKLYQEIDRLRETLDVPPFAEILLDDNFNAGVVQNPRFGFFGGYRSYLVIGLPLLLSLTTEQFRAVLAHELGHISRKHGGMGAWCYRMGMTWPRILYFLAEEGHSSVDIFFSFFRWYVPKFMAFSFALQRQEEYEADRMAAEAVGKKAMADALIQMYLIVRAHHEKKELAGMPHTVLNQWMNDALLVQDQLEDVHPVLAQRLHGLDQRAEVPPQEGKNAAVDLLGNFLPDFAGGVGISLVIQETADGTVKPTPIAPPVETGWDGR
jgi:Zn-dependent protease with chaperone function